MFLVFFVIFFVIFVKLIIWILILLVFNGLWICVFNFFVNVNVLSFFCVCGLVLSNWVVIIVYE